MKGYTLPRNLEAALNGEIIQKLLNWIKSAIFFLYGTFQADNFKKVDRRDGIQPEKARSSWIN